MPHTPSGTRLAKTVFPPKTWPREYTVVQKKHTVNHRMIDHPRNSPISPSKTRSETGKNPPCKIANARSVGSDPPPPPLTQVGPTAYSNHSGGSSDATQSDALSGSNPIAITL